MELRHLLKTNFELFDFPYTVDDSNFKKEVEQAIIDTYFFHEINGTPDYFKHSFRTRFLSAISYYNKLYNTTLLEYNPLINYKISESLDQLSNSTQHQEGNTQTTGSENTEDSGNTQTSESGNSKRTDDLQTTTNENTKGSDYPQQQITNNNYLSDETTRTGTTDNTGTQKTDSEVTGTTTDSRQGNRTQTNNTDNTQESQTNNTMNYEKTVEGLTGTSYQELIKKERENILRIVGMVVAEMKPCFILVYN